jgi:hypothetical protein
MVLAPFVHERRRILNGVELPDPREHSNRRRETNLGKYRFITHLQLTRTRRGKIKVSYRVCEADFLNVLTLWGPGFLKKLPDKPMKPVEFAAWTENLIRDDCELGWEPNSHRLKNTDSNRVTPIDYISVKELLLHTVCSVNTWIFKPPDDKSRTMCIEMSNRGRETIPAFSIALVHRHEVPQPNPKVPLLGPHAHVLSQPITLRKDGLNYESDLAPGQTVAFALSPDQYRTALSHAASLSPENQWIAMRIRGHEFERLEGKYLADLLEPQGLALMPHADWHIGDERLGFLFGV